MTANVDELLTAALELPPEVRATLAQRLIESLEDKEQATIDTAWLEEIGKRLAALDRGEARLFPADEVMRSLKIRNKS